MTLITLTPHIYIALGFLIFFPVLLPFPLVSQIIRLFTVEQYVLTTTAQSSKLRVHQDSTCARSRGQGECPRSDRALYGVSVLNLDLGCYNTENSHYNLCECYKTHRLTKHNMTSLWTLKYSQISVFSLGRCGKGSIAVGFNLIIMSKWASW